MSKTDPDDALGMKTTIDRRDFLQGALIAAGSGLTPALALAQAQDVLGYNPPIVTGMRGSHPGSFKTAHALRDQKLPARPPVDVDAPYDLIVVGAGISGLSAAKFYRAGIGPDARILILDNHDDFGGHAKRNKFHLRGRLHLMNGGTAAIESPRPYSPVAQSLLTSLGIEPDRLARMCEDPNLYPSLGLRTGVFFDAAEDDDFRGGLLARRLGACRGRRTALVRRRRRLHRAPEEASVRNGRRCSHMRSPNTTIASDPSSCALCGQMQKDEKDKVRFKPRDLESLRLFDFLLPRRRRTPDRRTPAQSHRPPDRPRLPNPRLILCRSQETPHDPWPSMIESRRSSSRRATSVFIFLKRRCALGSCGSQPLLCDLGSRMSQLGLVGVK